jgi:hypothetical protein
LTNSTVGVSTGWGLTEELQVRAPRARS